MNYCIYWQNGVTEGISGKSFVKAFLEIGYNVSHLGHIQLIVKNPESLPQSVLTQSEIMRIHWELLAIDFIKECPENYNPVLGNGFDRSSLEYFLNDIVHKF